MAQRSEPPWTTRAAVAGDLRFLATMLGCAVQWRPGLSPLDPETVLAEPALAHYLAGWPRAGDHGLIATGPELIGAAWWRQFSDEQPGYGYVAGDVPEVAIAVRAAWRGRGVGTGLLKALIAAAASRGLRALSLTVALENPARELYERHGFAAVDHAGDAVTMLREL